MADRNGSHDRPHSQRRLELLPGGRPVGRARPRQMMRKVRLPLAILDKPDTPIAVPALRRLLEISAAESGAEDFGLRLAERGGLTNFGAVGLIVREQATVGEAIEAFSRFIHVHHD